MNKILISIVMVSMFGLQNIFAMAGGPTPEQRLFAAVSSDVLGQESILSLVRAALDQAANINATFGIMQQTALYTAVIKRRPAVVQLLLSRGANPDLANVSGDTPLHIAVLGRQSDMVELLLNNRANPNIANNAGNTPLHIAVLRRQPDIVRLLLDNGADPRLRNNAGQASLEILRGFPLAEQNNPVIKQMRQYFVEAARSTPEVASPVFETSLE